YLIIGTGLLITVLGLVMVFSASQIQALRYDLAPTYYFRKQLLAAVLGTGLLLVASRIPVRLLRALTYPFLSASLVLLVLVQVSGVGVEFNASTSWSTLVGCCQLQLSEFAKLALALWDADLLSRKGELLLLTQWRDLLFPLVSVALLV